MNPAVKGTVTTAFGNGVDRGMIRRVKIAHTISGILVAAAAACSWQSPPADAQDSLYRLRPGDRVEVRWGFNAIEHTPYRLSPGDIIAIRFITAPELDIEQRVRPDGYIALPYVGDVFAADSTPEGLRTMLKGQYTGYLSSPELVVVLRETGGMRADLRETLKDAGVRTITVRSDGYGTMPFAGDVRLEGLTIAQARERAVAIYKARGLTGEVTLALTSADGARISIIGAVNEPKNISVGRPLGLFDAIAMAGGFRNDARASSVIIIRNRDGTLGYERVHARKALRGRIKRQPAPLCPGDIVYVPRMGIARAGEIAHHIGQLLFFRGFSIDAGRYLLP